MGTSQGQPCRFQKGDKKSSTLELGVHGGCKIFGCSCGVMGQLGKCGLHFLVVLSMNDQQPAQIPTHVH